jgi:hypothetical protein
MTPRYQPRRRKMVHDLAKGRNNWSGIGYRALEHGVADRVGWRADRSQATFGRVARPLRVTYWMFPHPKGEFL